MEGVVLWFDKKKGFGFIECPGKKDCFVHYESILANGFKTLTQGQSVRFDLIETGKKGPAAVNVEIIGEAPMPENIVTDGPDEGIVKEFHREKGFGFIERRIGRDVFVHYKNILMDGRKVLTPGQKVRFDVLDGPKGPAASNVKVI